MTDRDPNGPPGEGPRERRLESQHSQAAQTSSAEHDDALSPGQALADSVNAAISQRVGSSPPVANPVVSFPERPAADPEPSEDESERS